MMGWLVISRAKEAAGGDAPPWKHEAISAASPARKNHAQRHRPKPRGNCCRKWRSSVMAQLDDIKKVQICNDIGECAALQALHEPIPGNRANFTMGLQVVPVGK
jgi:hypothetical protein